MKETRGAIFFSKEGYLVLSENIFIGNEAWYGGAIYIGIESTVLTSNNQFSHNVALTSGGAIDCNECTLILKGNSSFDNNRLTSFEQYAWGGAIQISNGFLTTLGTVVLSNNRAMEGGAIYLYDSSAIFDGHSILFTYNKAEVGGGMSISYSHVYVRGIASRLEFSGNVAEKFGGGLNIVARIGFRSSSVVNISSAIFLHNRAECGGAMFVKREKNIIFTNTRIAENSGSALCISDGKLTFAETIYGNIEQ